MILFFLLILRSIYTCIQTAPPKKEEKATKQVRYYFVLTVIDIDADARHWFTGTRRMLEDPSTAPPSLR